MWKEGLYLKEYFCDISTISEEEFNRWFQEMSPQRQDKCNRMIKELAKKQCIAADHLMKISLGECLNCSPKEIEIKLFPSGKPYLEGNPVYFSISHSGNLVACVVSHRPVGIDVELVRPIEPSIQERICTDAELKHLRSFKNEEERNLRFFTLWTRKEALFKQNGTLPRNDRGNDVLTPGDDLTFQTHIRAGYVISVAK